MRISSLSRVVNIGVAFVLLAGCGAGAPSVVAQLPSLSPDAHGRNLLYVSAQFFGMTFIYTYPGGNFVGTLSTSSDTNALCSNAAGDVFITTAYQIFEYPHGLSTPVAILGNGAQGCSVDPVTGDLAAYFADTIYVYTPATHHRWHLPRVLFLDGESASCAYDASGNLFVDGQSSGTTPFLLELPKGASDFEEINLNQNVGKPGNMQWDGQYLAIGDRNDTLVRRFAINGNKGTQIGTLRLRGASLVNQFWIQGNIIVGAGFSNSEYFTGFWNYPAGGRPNKTIPQIDAFGETVSVVRP